MRVYVATSFKNIPEARAVMHALLMAGHEITHDWTDKCIDPSWPLEQQHAYMQECGAADWQGVESADALVFINHPECRDAMAEMGAALAMGKPVLALYPARRPSVFFHRAAVLCSSLPQLLNHL